VTGASAPFSYQNKRLVDTNRSGFFLKKYLQNI
jgi:hypothetical protein